MKYQSDAFHYTGTEILENLEEAVNYNQTLVDLVVRFAPSQRERMRVLDFGAGVGTFSKLLRKKGFMIDCFEVDQAESELLRKEGFKVYGDFSELGDETYDFIYSLNVLEHIEDHVGAITNLKKKLKPKGRTFVFVPAYQVLYSNFDKMVGHHRRYHKKDLRAVLEEGGLTIEKINYFDSVGFLVAYAFKLIGSKPEDVTKKKIIFFDRVVFPVSKLTDPLCRGFVGKNLYAVCNKK